MDDDDLTWLPIPLATGEVLPGVTERASIRRITVTIETEDGATQTHELAYEGGGWRMPEAVMAS